MIAVRLGLRPNSNTVFTDYYQAGTWWRDSQVVYEKNTLFRYSPLVAALFSLLTYLPLAVAQYPWMAVGVVALGGALAVWLRTCPPRTPNSDERWAILLLATPLLIGNINNLQANPLMLALLMLGLAWTQQQRWWLAAVALAGAALLKVYPLALALILVLHYPRQLSWRLAIALAVGALLPFLFQSPTYVVDTYKQWFHLNAADTRQTVALERQYQDATVLWTRWTGPMDLHALRLWQASTAALVALVALWARWWRIHTNARLMFLFGLVVAWMLLAGPSTESATYILAAPLVAWLAVDAHTEKRLGLSLIAWTAYGLLMIAAASTPFAFSAKFKAIGWQPLAVMVMLAAFRVWLRRWRSSAPPAPLPIIPQ